VTELRIAPDGVHAITPKCGTAVSVRTGVPGDLTDVMTFPVRTECTECGGLAVCERVMSLSPDGGWRHEELSA